MSDDAPMTGTRQPFARQLARLIKREREVNGLMRRLARVDMWSSSTVSLASAISLSTNRHEALESLGHALVDELGFDYARMDWADDVVEYPPLETPEDRVCVDGLVQALSDVEAETSGIASTDDAPFAELRRYSITSRHRPGDAVNFVTGYRRQTFRYVEASDTAERLRELSLMLVHPFDALRLRLDLVHERDTLQDRVDEATRHLRVALKNADAARLAAERAARVRSQFLAHMSHEIRTPMTAIIGYTDLLSDPVPRPAEERRRYLNIIQRSGHHLLQLLNDVLDLARIESGLFTLEPVEGSVPRLLGDVFSLLRVRVPSDRLELRLVFDGLLPTLVRTDLPRLRQVLLNVVGNALKFTDEGWVEVRARIESRPDPDVCVLVVEVEDTGVGIADEMMESIFEEFRTHRPQSASSSGGTGLGLAIAQRLARLMGGGIEVRSQLGSGTCFTIRVQAELLDGSGWVPAQSALAQPTEKPTPPLNERFHGRVLLAEDTKVIRTVVAAYLNSLGLKVDGVEDGQAACEAVAAAPLTYDIIFMDMQMPRVDGYQATRRLRAEGIKTPIIALTAHAMLGERERCLEVGCSDYLAKPVDRTKLHAVLQNYIGAETSQARPRPTLSEDDVLAGLIRDFYADLAHQRDALDSAIQRGDIRAIGGLTHKLAGAASTFGYPELAARARSLEHATRTGTTDPLVREHARSLLREIAMVLQTA